MLIHYESTPIHNTNHIQTSDYDHTAVTGSFSWQSIIRMEVSPYGEYG